MSFWLEIVFAALFTILLYFAFRAAYILFARHELDMSACKRRSDAIEVFADADALEYYLRMALAVADGNIAVVAYLKKESGEKADMLDTVLRFRRTHKNLSYQWI